jgi:hypothetical protein
MIEETWRVYVDSEDGRFRTFEATPDVWRKVYDELRERFESGCSANQVCSPPNPRIDYVKSWGPGEDEPEHFTPVFEAAELSAATRGVIIAIEHPHELSDTLANAIREHVMRDLADFADALGIEIGVTIVPNGAATNIAAV